MASTILDPVAVLLAGVVDSLAVTPAVKAYPRDPGTAGLDKVPAAVVGLPTVYRVGVEEDEPEVGSHGWTLTYPVVFFFDLADAPAAAAEATEILEAFITAMDADAVPIADSSIVDAKVTEAIPSEVLDTARPLIAYECRVELLKLVA